METGGPTAGGLKMKRVPRVKKAYGPEGADAAAIQEAIELCPVTCIYWDEVE